MTEPATLPFQQILAYIGASFLIIVAVVFLVCVKAGHWIPVSERLPESDGYYLVTEKSGRVCVYVFHKEGNSEEYWKRCIVAWMPLPEPYKAESEGEI